MTIFFPAGLKVLTTYIGQAIDQTVNQKPDELTEFAAGDWAPGFVGAAREEPQIDFQTNDITSVLDLMTTDNLLLKANAGTISLYFRKGDNLSHRVAHGTSAHMLYKLISNSMFYWEQITASQREQARIETSIVPVWGSTYRPITQVPLQPIDEPVSTPTLKLWTVGPVFINGTEVPRMKSWSWKNNCDILRDDSSGNDAPDIALMRRVRPVLTLESTDIATLATFANGVAVTTLSVYLRRRQENLINYADAELVHVKLSATNGSARFQRTSGDPASGQLQVQISRDSGGLFFDYDKDIAITT